MFYGVWNLLNLASFFGQSVRLFTEGTVEAAEEAGVGGAGAMEVTALAAAAAAATTSWHLAAPQGTACDVFSSGGETKW